MRTQHVSSSAAAPFTSHLQYALVFAGNAAAQLQHAYIGTEHLLLGVVQDKRIAALFGVTSDDVQHALEDVLKNTTPTAPSILVMHPTARQAVTCAIDEAGRRHHQAIDTPHLLLALLLDDTNGAAQILTQLGISIEQAWANTEELLCRQDAKDAERPGC